MKKLIALLLAGLVLLSLGACHKEQIPEAITFEGQTLLDTQICSFRVEAIREDEFEGCVMDVQIQNKADTDLLFSINSASVNGCMCDPYYSETVVAGQALSTQVTFSASDLEAYGITTVTELQFTLSVYDETTYEEVCIEETFTLYPRGENAVQYQRRESQKSDIILMDNEYCSVIVTGKDPESFWGYDLYIYLINKTDKTLILSAEDAAINATPCDPYWAATVAPEKCANTTMYWFDTTLEDAGVTDVQSITMALSVSDLDQWMDPLVTETVTLTP